MHFFLRLFAFLLLFSWSNLNFISTVNGGSTGSSSLNSNPQDYYSSPYTNSYPNPNPNYYYPAPEQAPQPSIIEPQASESKKPMDYHFHFDMPKMPNNNNMGNMRNRSRPRGDMGMSYGGTGLSSYGGGGGGGGNFPTKELLYALGIIGTKGITAFAFSIPIIFLLIFMLLKPILLLSLLTLGLAAKLPIITLLGGAVSMVLGQSIGMNIPGFPGATTTTTTTTVAPGPIGPSTPPPLIPAVPLYADFSGFTHSKYDPYVYYNPFGINQYTNNRWTQKRKKDKIGVTEKDLAKVVLSSEDCIERLACELAKEKIAYAESEEVEEFLNSTLESSKKLSSLQEKIKKTDYSKKECHTYKCKRFSFIRRAFKWYK